MTDNLPNHIGFILDGNRRWAKKRGLPTLSGHKKGYDNFKVISDYCFKCGIKIITAYVFSTENWNRTAREVSYLMRLLKKMLVEETNILHKKGIKIKVLGLKTKLDKQILKMIDEAEKLTADNKNGVVNLCLNYGGRSEIIEAIKKLILQKIPVENITEKIVAKNLWTAGQPDPDFIIRTSGEMRLSGFLPWQSVYSELYFSPKMWPEFSTADIDEALAEYARRQRRFGGN